MAVKKSNGSPKKKRRRLKHTVIQMHHPIKTENRTPFDELFTIPLRMSHHRLVARAVQTLKNTVENLRQIRALIDALNAEYLLRLRELRIKGIIKDEEYKEYVRGGDNDGTIGEFHSQHNLEDGCGGEEDRG